MKMIFDQCDDMVRTARSNQDTHVRPKRGRPTKVRDSEPVPIKTLDKALRLLTVLAENGPITQSDLARTMQEPQANIHRILLTFASQGFAFYDTSTQHWDVGPKAFRVGFSYFRPTQLRLRAKAALQALANDTGYTALLCQLINNDVVVVDQSLAQGGNVANFPLGSRLHPTISAHGKMLLATASKAKQKRTLQAAGNLDRMDDLKMIFENIRAANYATDKNEMYASVSGCASIVHDEFNQPVAAIGVYGISSTLSANSLESLRQPVQQAAAIGEMAYLGVDRSI